MFQRLVVRPKCNTVVPYISYLSTECHLLVCALVLCCGLSAGCLPSAGIHPAGKATCLRVEEQVVF